MTKPIEKRDLVLWLLVLILILGLALQSVSLLKTKKELKNIQSAQIAMRVGGLPQDWDPFLEMERMQQHINSLFSHSLNSLMHGPSAGFPQLPQFEPDADIRETENEPVPLHLRNAPTDLMKNLGYGKGYKYNPNFKEPVRQDYLPDKLKGKKYLK